MYKDSEEPRQSPRIAPEEENSPDEPLEIVFIEELEADKSAETDSVTKQKPSVPSADPASQGGA